MYHGLSFGFSGFAEELADEVAEAEAGRDGADERTDVRDESQEFDKDDADCVLEENVHFFLLEDFFGEEITDDAARDGFCKIDEEDVRSYAD